MVKASQTAPEYGHGIERSTAETIKYNIGETLGQIAALEADSLVSQEADRLGIGPDLIKLYQQEIGRYAALDPARAQRGEVLEIEISFRSRRNELYRDALANL